MARGFSKAAAASVFCERWSECTVRAIEWIARVLRVEPYVKECQLPNLYKSAYLAGRLTRFERFHNDYIWNPTAERLPRWVHPNLLTVVAFFFSTCMTYIPIVLPDVLGASTPRVVYLIAAISVWLYHLLDAIDGKQARRLKLVSPLGQLFDHGCDALTTHVFVLLFLYVLKIRYKWMFLALMHCTSYNLLFSSWYEYENELFMTSFSEYVAVTELQYSIISFLLLTFFWPGIWVWRPLSLLPAAVTRALDFAPLNATCSDIVTFGGVVVGCVLNFTPTLSMLKTRKFRNLSGSWNVFLTLQLHFLALFLFGATDMFSKYPFCFALVVSVFGADLVWRFILSRCTHTPLRLLDAHTLPYYAGSMLIYSVRQRPVAFCLASLAMSAYAALYLTLFAFLNIRQLCRFLKITLFVVPPEVVSGTSATSESVSSQPAAPKVSSASASDGSASASPRADGAEAAAE